VGEAVAEASVKGLIADLREGGPVALPDLRKRFDGLSEDAPGKALLEEVHARFERIVMEAEFYPAIPSDTEDTSKALAALVGKPLASEPLLRVLAAFATHSPPGAQGLEVLVNRAEAGVPLSVTARCLWERPENRPRSSDRVWESELDYVAGGGGGSGRGDSLDAEGAKVATRYLNLAKGIEKALQAATGGKLALKLTLLRPEGP
jgi:hypothetical protein